MVQSPDNFASGLEVYVDPHTIDGCVVSDRTCPGMDVLKVRADVHPWADLELVVGLNAGLVTWTEYCLRNRAKFIAGTDIVPADAKLIATLLTDRAVTSQAGTEEVLDRRRICITDRMHAQTSRSRDPVCL